MGEKVGKTVAERALTGVRPCEGFNLYPVCAIRGVQYIPMGCLPGDVDPSTLVTQNPERYRGADRFAVSGCSHPDICPMR